MVKHFTWFLFILLLVFGCRNNNMKAILILTNEKKTPSETGRDVEFLISDSGFVKAKLNAPLLETYVADPPYSEMTKGLRVVFYNRDKNPTGFLRGDYGIRYPDKKIIEVKYNVVVVNTKNDTFTTEHLTWNEAKDKVYSNNYVRVKTKDEIIIGKGFESDPSFTNYEFTNIKGVISLEKSK